MYSRSAACYAVSRSGAQQLLARYWPAAPRADGGVTIDLRSQRYAAADQLVFNLSGAWVLPPLLTQRVKGAHAEHARFKRLAREFVLRTWFRGWGGDPLRRDASFNVSFDEWLAREQPGEASDEPIDEGGGEGAANQGGRKRSKGRRKGRRQNASS